MDLLQQTLAGSAPDVLNGETPWLRWYWRDEGIIEFIPRHETHQAVVVSAGLHGNETAPVEIVNQLVSQLLSGEKPLQPRLLVILGNPAALRTNQRYLRVDINRLFGGRWQRNEDCAEARRAWQLERALESFWQGTEAQTPRWHLDLHTAIRGSYHPRFGVLPFCQRPWPQDFMHWLSAAGLEALVFHRAPGGTFSHYSSEHFAAISCTLELGKAQPFGQNDLTQFAAAQQALASLLFGDALPPVAEEPRRYRVAQQITRHTAAFQLHMSGETLNFTAFPQGTLLAEDGEDRYYVQQAREYVLFPNPAVATGLRAGLMLVEDNAYNVALSAETVS